ncbi:glycine cleavage system aminomethyltransferase GcvT [Zooshikella sp. RANM57]|uniref:glycine cleavage system aminomethyltransferase GcvT n=1 Tax=Zooshikella sp. RANM57 TaxID=3425863 RepID=UPI003D6E40B3
MTITNAPLQQTPLNTLHEELGAKMVPFAGYHMPLQYPMGIKQEHLHTRSQAGLFDVSHMGQVWLPLEAEAGLEKLVPVDILDLPVGKQRYALFTNEEGGILDDLMVARFSDGFMLVINAACKEQDIAHLRQHLGADMVNVLSDQALVALQGPAAANVLSHFINELDTMLFMDVRKVTLCGAECFISRSGYTGEDGFEISIPAADAQTVVKAILEHPEVAPIGLGARDSLRLEAGLCLYGNDIDKSTTPIEAALNWAISKSRRTGGNRAGGFIGAKTILAQLDKITPVQRKRVGLRTQGKAPIRTGTPLVNATGESIGSVTSGGFGPSLGAPVAMGYVNSEYASIDTELFAEVRGKRLPVNVCKMPFVPQRYYRG